GVTLERGPRARRAIGDSEPCADIARGRREEHRTVEATVEEDTEKPPRLPVDAVHGGDHGAHPGVEREWAEVSGVVTERLDIVRDRLVYLSPVQIRCERRRRLVGIVRLAHARHERPPL